MDNQVIIFEAPKIVPPEFRLYYDDTGRVICYTCEKLPGKYIVVDKDTFAEGRPDIRVVDGKVSKAKQRAVVSKLVKSNEGKACATEDISIVVNAEEYTGKITFWKLETNEYN